MLPNLLAAGWVIVFRDVSVLLEAKNEKRCIEKKMREAQRLESLGAALLESEKQILAVSEAERRRIGADLHVPDFQARAT